MRNLKKYNEFTINESSYDPTAWREQLKKTLEGWIYYMPEGTMILRDKTKNERPSKNGRWLVEYSGNPKTAAHMMGDKVYFYDYPADYEVPIDRLETEPQEELKNRYIQFKLRVYESKLKNSKESWGFGDEGERGMSSPRDKQTIEDIAWLKEFIKSRG